ncbi:unnamed protein product [Chrysoparadoxa australica]
MMEEENIGNTPLHTAAEDGNLARLQQLLATIEVDARNDRGHTPLIIACTNGHVNCAMALLQAGADINAQDNNLRSSLWDACEECHVPMAQMLLEHGADIDARDVMGYTPLMRAAWQEHGEECTIAMVEGGADVTLRGAFENTALHLASTMGMVRAVRLLIARGADPDAENEDGEHPLVYCERSWDEMFEAFPFLTEAVQAEVLDVLRKASRDVALWRGRRVVVMLQARHELGQDILGGGSPNASPGSEAVDTALQAQMMFIVTRPDHEMQALFRRIVRFL